MSKPLELGASLFLVSVGQAHALDLYDPSRAGCQPAQGLLLHQTTATGAPLELFVASPTDLLAWADMAAATILKPVVLPLVLGEVRPGRINAFLRTDPAAERLAKIILAGLPALSNPARPAGVVKPRKSGT